MDNLKAIELIIPLVAKTGLFFSCVDGQYADSERRFIQNYLDQLAAVGDISEVKDLIEGAAKQQITLDEIIADTRRLLDTFDSPDDKRAVMLALYNFVDNVIKADGQEHPAELQAVTQWLEALK
ncbi:MAG: TerB family tellurite resistance protein [Muribaculaceae bacterium]|nr:TerB family tellurite resistance protein [Muribaculaceae bacterium]